jgi:hypothetical protein
MLRMWDEEVGPGQVEWRAKVKRIANGETRYLRQWDALLDILLAMINDKGTEGTEDDGPASDAKDTGTNAD